MTTYTQFVAQRNGVTEMYTDKKGKQWILIALTAQSAYGWFRPADHADDGSYDVRLKMADMTAPA